MKNYTITLEVLTPVYIGNGNKILKKDFNVMNSYANIHDPIKLYTVLGKHYENFLMDNSTLTDYLNYNKINNNKTIKYRVFCGTSNIRKSDSIDEFIKDPYCCPYIPGSSLKGAIRTAVLSGLVEQKEGTDRYLYFRNLNSFGETTKIEEKAFGEIIKNKFRHIKISDSDPLTTEDLILCKKIDIFKDGNTNNNLNLCRESLKVGTKINLKLTIDDAENNWQNPWTPKQIMGSIKHFNRNYKGKYLSEFSSYVNKYGDDIIYLGGGTGFHTKTIINSLYGENSLKMTSKCLQANFKKHNHWKDEKIGVSPRAIKCTKVNNQIVEMGICRIRID